VSGDARGKLVRLRVELERERDILRALSEETAKYAPRLRELDVEAPILAYVGVELHRYYTCLENILVRIERVFGVERAGGDWHLELLQGSALDLPGVRPAILPEAHLGELRELMRFRHFFRHAYAVALDRRKLVAVVGDFVRVADVVDQSLALFARFLDESAAAFSRGS
jgi:hypothetical protein